jgi:hypothetical protein
VKCDKKLKILPLNDGPPWGFDADLIMKSQDYMDVWTNINKAKVLGKRIIGNKAHLRLSFGGYKMKFDLTKIKALGLLILLNRSNSRPCEK